MKQVLMIANFASGLDKGVNSRITYLADMLVNNNSVELIASDFSHLNKTIRVGDYSDFSYKVTLLHEPGYKKNVCLKRFYSHYIWGKNVKRYLNNLEMKPDVVYCTVPSLTGSLAAAKFCKKNNIRFIIDIQDLWPEAFEMVIRIPIITKLIFLPFRILANKIYSSADSVCAVSDTYVNRAKRVNDKCNTKTVFLGTDLSSFDKNLSIDPLLIKNSNEIWIGYCGTLGNSYDLTCVIDAVNILVKENYNNIKLIVMGDGPKKDEFEFYAKKIGIPAVFTGYLDYNNMCSQLSQCDIAVNPINHGAAQSIINKHSDYTAAGLPIVSTQESKEFIDLVNNYNMGFNCKNNDSNDLAEKIEILINSAQLRKEMGANARRCAEEKFDRRNSYKEIISLILEGK